MLIDAVECLLGTAPARIPRFLRCGSSPSLTGLGTRQDGAAGSQGVGWRRIPRQPTGRAREMVAAVGKRSLSMDAPLGVW